jgi:hypothetical protein
MRRRIAVSAAIRSASGFLRKRLPYVHHDAVEGSERRDRRRFNSTPLTSPEDQKRDAMSLKRLANGRPCRVAHVLAAGLQFLESRQRNEALVGKHFLCPPEEGASRAYLLRTDHGEINSGKDAQGATNTAIFSRFFRSSMRGRSSSTDHQL